jgi:hypothetical protein
MIFGGKNLIEVFLNLEDRSGYEIGCWNHVPLLKETKGCIKSK